MHQSKNALYNKGQLRGFRQKFFHYFTRPSNIRLYIITLTDEMPFSIYTFQTLLKHILGNFNYFFYIL